MPFHVTRRGGEHTCTDVRTCPYSFMPDVLPEVDINDISDDLRFEALTEWAGYNPDGYDYKGHLHPHPKGRFIRSDGLKGFFCAAPLDPSKTDHKGNAGICTDPDPRYFLDPTFPEGHLTLNGTTGSINGD